MVLEELVPLPGWTVEVVICLEEIWTWTLMRAFGRSYASKECYEESPGFYFDVI